MLHNKYDVVVVGGGPAGSMAAWEIAKKGVSVCMLEKDRDIGYPVRCGEAAGESGLKQFVDIQDRWVAEKITSAKLVSPNFTAVDVNFAAETGYILNRRIFDYDLSRYAANAGAEVYTKAYVKDISTENRRVNGVVLDYLGEEKKIMTKIEKTDIENIKNLENHLESNLVIKYLIMLILYLCQYLKKYYFICLHLIHINFNITQ